MKTQTKKVEIFSTPTCHYCHLAKDFFTEHKIEFIDYDVTKDKNRRQELIDLGAMGVPLIRITENEVEDFNKTVVDPKKIKSPEPEILHGFDVERLKEIFNVK